MDPAMIPRRAPITFNSPLEAGMRAVAILGAAYPQTYDLQRLVTLDFLLVHTADVGGPDNLHPSTPMHSAEILVRRKLVEQALLLMMTRDLVEREVGLEGFKYAAGENAFMFLSSLTTPYLRDMQARAQWLIKRYGGHSDLEFKVVMRSFFAKWVEEFQDQERSRGEDI